MKNLIYILIFTTILFSCKKDVNSIEGQWEIDNVEYLNPETNLLNFAFITQSKITEMNIKNGMIFSLNEKDEVVEQNSYKIIESSLYLDEQERAFNYVFIDNDNLILDFKDIKLTLTRK